MSNRDSLSDEDDMSRGGPSESRYGGQSMRSRYTQSKTGGMFAIDGLREEHKSRELQFQRDEFNSFEFEMQQLEPDKVKKSQKYVESLVTGQYYKVSNSFDPSELGPGDGSKDLDGDGIISTVEKIDTAMKEQQKVWVNNLNNGFNFTLGLLAGLSLLELFFLAFTSDKVVFIQSYQNFANLTTIIQISLNNIAFILGLTLTLIYGQRAQQLTMTKDPKRLEFQKLYNFTAVSTFMVFLSWISLQVLPKYSNKIQVMPLDQFTDEDFQVFSSLSYIKDVCLILTWIVVSFNNKSSVSEVELDPEDPIDDQDADGPDDDGDDNLDTDMI